MIEVRGFPFLRQASGAAGLEAYCALKAVTFIGA
jgi:hypothetical protein